MRSAYLISYDISDDKRRNAVFKTLMDNGDHVQYSVFICELSRLEHARLLSELEDAIHAAEDQVIFLRVGSMESLDKALECLGRRWEPMCRVQIV
jgi:CRISPR-associated protein Cas2